MIFAVFDVLVTAFRHLCVYKLQFCTFVFAVLLQFVTDYQLLRNYFSS